MQQQVTIAVGCCSMSAVVHRMPCQNADEVAASKRARRVRRARAHGPGRWARGPYRSARGIQGVNVLPMYT